MLRGEQWGGRRVVGSEWQPTAQHGSWHYKCAFGMSRTIPCLPLCRLQTQRMARAPIGCFADTCFRHAPPTLQVGGTTVE